MNTNDPAVEKSKLVVDALAYANTNNLDIKNKEDVAKILQTLDPEHTSEEDVEEFMKLLQGADDLMQADVEHRKSTN